jgi:hypothetical protein
VEILTGTGIEIDLAQRMPQDQTVAEALGFGTLMGLD